MWVGVGLNVVSIVLVGVVAMVGGSDGAASDKNPLVGVLLVLGCFAALWVSGTRIARQSRDRFALLTALAMTSALTLPAAVNAAVVMGLLPTKGLTLPFLSHGGTSLIMSCVTLGVLLNTGRVMGKPRSRRSAR